jgi:hypothetical protein
MLVRIEIFKSNLMAYTLKWKNFGTDPRKKKKKSFRRRKKSKKLRIYRSVSRDTCKLSTLIMLINRRSTSRRKFNSAKQYN